MLRSAVELDLPRLLELAVAYSAEVPDNKFPIDEEYAVASMAEAMLCDDNYCKVLLVDGRVVGFLWAFICTQPWSLSKIAFDNIFYISPEFRGGYGVISLIKDYYKWSVDKGAKEVCISTASGIDTTKVCRIFEAIGFKLSGYQYRR